MPPAASHGATPTLGSEPQHVPRLRVGMMTPGAISLDIGTEEEDEDEDEDEEDGMVARRLLLLLLIIIVVWLVTETHVAFSGWTVLSSHSRKYESCAAAPRLPPAEP